MAANLKKIYQNPRLLAIFFLGFSSGLPLMLVAGGTAMQVWLNESGVDLATIGRFALVGLPYALKFLWAPFLDTLAPPFLGRRRGWGLITQLGLTASIVLLAFADPSTHIAQVALLSLLVAFFSASQDIVLDALRTEMLSPEEIGPGGSVYLVGYRLAVLVSGAAALVISSKFASHFAGQISGQISAQGTASAANAIPLAAKLLAWRYTYLVMASLMSVGIATLVLVKEPRAEKSRTKLSLNFRGRIVEPFAEFFKRPRSMSILLFVMLYKLPTLMATALTTVFLMGLGFEKIEIAAVTKVVGLIATLVGTMAGGSLIARFGLRASLWIFGVAQALGGSLFIILAIVGKNHALMSAVIGADNFLMGLGTAAIVGFMMSICSRQFTGTQYALFSSLTAFTRVILITPAGTLAKMMGWPLFYVFSVLLAIPGLLLLTQFRSWTELSRQKSAKRLQVLDFMVIGVFLLSLIVISTDFVWPMIGLPDVALKVGGGGLVFTLLLWASKEFSTRKKTSRATSETR